MPFYIILKQEDAIDSVADDLSYIYRFINCKQAKLRLLVRRTDRILIGAKIQICAYANTRV